MVWVIGCNGMLASEIVSQMEAKKIAFVGTDREVDITDESAVLEFAKMNKPDWIVNCAAYTAVDNAEDDKDFAEKLNAQGPLNIAKAAKSIKAKLIHISTDYVFDGNGSHPYKEDDVSNPQSVYGATKLEGEKNILAEYKESSWIIRTAWLYGWAGKNFVYTMCHLMNERESVSVVNDQRGTPTFVGTLARVVLALIEQVSVGKNVPTGIYHCTDLGEITWFDFAKEIYALGRKHGRIMNECDLRSCDSSSFPHKAHRPAYSVLDKTKIQTVLGIGLPDWKESLEMFFMEEKWHYMN